MHPLNNAHVHSIESLSWNIENSLGFVNISIYVFSTTLMELAKVVERLQ